MRAAIFTALALIAFAANSLLARAALADGAITAEAFTVIRVISGALMLSALLFLSQKQAVESQHQSKTLPGSLVGAAALLVYATAFSFAYLKLDTGTGALVLFTIVQLTILVKAAISDGLRTEEMIGAALAFGGFVYLIAPTLGTPSLMGILLMTASGIGWGIYTLLGRNSAQPLAETCGNFIRASLFCLPAAALFLWPELSAAELPAGVHAALFYAVISGAVTSGLGYAIWYAALPNLTRSLAATVQLLVPPLAALMGAVFLSETLSPRLGIAIFVISLGIFIVIRAKPKTINTEYIQ